MSDIGTIEQLCEDQALWYYSFDQEVWYGNCHSRAEAIELGMREGSGDPFWTALCTKKFTRLSRYFEDRDLYRWLERIDEEEEMHDPEDPCPDPHVDMTDEQEQDLIDLIRVTIDEWQERHQLVFPQWAFSNIQDEMQHNV